MESEGPGLIVGLGNPGERYRDTRHNLGFRVLDRLAERLDAGTSRVECNAVVAEAETVARGDTESRWNPLALAWPQTYMNRSGYSVRCLADRLEIEPSRILIVYDDVMLPLAKLRARPRGGAGGHNGMESVLENLRTETVGRLRIGVGAEDGPPPVEELSDYVLDDFPADQHEIVEGSIERAAEACESWLREGAEATMNRYNVG